MDIASGGTQAGLESQKVKTFEQTLTSQGTLGERNVFKAEKSGPATVKEPGPVVRNGPTTHPAIAAKDSAREQSKDGGSEHIAPKIVDINHEGQQQQALLLSAELKEALKTTIDKAREFGMTRDKLRARQTVRTSFGAYGNAKRRRLVDLIDSSPGDARHEKRRKRARVQDQELLRMLHEADDEQQDYMQQLRENNVMAS